ncbi:ribokinase [Cytobacillus gottheilii]|uniref:ribokinase n=1 Tax=Cytobacillus gottheilii TaxID=859144 RepID=UPI0009B9EE3E|nr:ribokinase [Cytobacillus gottheilii]
MITVIGSINMDLVTITKKEPALGETVMGESFFTVPGGKGANQAVAAAKLGVPVKMIGCVGYDLFGEQYINHLKDHQIDIEHVRRLKNEKTGIASITVWNNDNKIIVVPGANKRITPEMVESHREEILKSSWLLLQFEIPLESIEKALEIAAEGNVNVILNPAPYHEIPENWLDKITYITPNEAEAKQLFSAFANKESLLPKLIITKGKDGVEYFSKGERVTIPALNVEAVDTTGAGDTFTGALAVALSEGLPLKESCQFAVKAAGFSVTKLGAQAGMPSRSDLNKETENR